MKMTDNQYRYIWDPDTKMVVKIDMPTLRDQFAMAALTGISYRSFPPEEIAKLAYELADSMLEARK